MLQGRKGDYFISTIDKTRINGAIRASNLRVIDSDGSQIGVISRAEALSMAQLAGLDLVEVSPDADPPVARIVDWGKYVYQKNKQQQKSKQNQKSQDLKQIRFGLKIGTNDLEIKIRKIKEFLEEGHKVRISTFYRGRELAHKELGYELLDRVYKTIEDSAVIEQEPQMAGKYLSMQIRKR